MSTVIEFRRQNEARAEWVDLGPLDELPILGARLVKTPGAKIAVFRTRDDEVFALEDSCPHRGGPLSQGIVTGKQVICPLHDWCISLEDGCAQAPDDGHTGTYPVKVEAGRVYISLTRG